MTDPGARAENKLRSDTRRRIIDAATVLFGRDGYPGTGLKKIAVQSGAPFGSIYHFFPGGKQELAAEMVHESGAAYGALVMNLLRSVEDPVQSLTAAFAQLAAQLDDSGYADACPIATLALEVASTNETLRETTAEVFASWIDDLTEWFAHWLDMIKARELALTLLMAMEGSFVLSRAARDTEPVLVAGQSVVALLQRHLADNPPARSARSPKK